MVAITAVGLIAGDGPGPIAGFQAREHVPDRKQVRLMSRPVQLGVAAVRAALEGRPGWQAIPPERRGLFVGTSPGSGEVADLLPAIEVARTEAGFDARRFGELGIPLVPPLWLVRGLTNNIVGFASALHDLRGPNTTRCDGATAGLAALLDGIRAVAEERADLVIAGGADSLVHAAGLVPEASEGAAFFVVERAEAAAVEAPRVIGGGTAFDAASAATDPLGAAGAVVALARRLLAGERAFRAEVCDASGARAWLEVG